MNLKQILMVLVARSWVVALVLFLTVGATTAVTMLLPRSYTATATLVIEPKFTDVLGGANLGAQFASQTYMATQMDILKSPKVSERVVRDLGLQNNPAAISRWREETQGKGDIIGYYAGILSKNLDVKPSRESLVLMLSFTGADPVFAKTVTDAFANAYIATNLELRTTPARLQTEWFNDQLKSLRGDFEVAQARLSAFQQRNGLVGSDERLDIEGARLAELSTQLSLAQSQTTDARSRSRVSEPSVTSPPEVSGSPVVQSLRVDIVRAEAKLSDAAQQFGPMHPTYQRMSAELDSLRDKLQSELRNSSSSVAAVTRVNADREIQLRSAVASQKEKVLEVKRLRDEMAVLSREAEGAQRMYEVALQRFAATNLESQTTQASAYLLAPALAPSTPSSPKVTLNIGLSAVLGLMLGLATALLLELSDRRVRSSSDLSGVLQLPVLATLKGRERPVLSAPRRPAALIGA